MGPTGVGKLAFARRFANLLLCEQPSKEGEPCGDCAACCLFAAESHPDFRQVDIESGAKVIKIEQIRALNEYVSLTSSYRRYKVAILANADAMNTNAANALLKTLEEPPAKTCIILVASQPAKLPATIRSRTQQLVFTLPTQTDALDYLSTFGDAQTAQRRLILGMGAPLACQADAVNDSWQERQKLFDAFYRVMTTREKIVAEAGVWAGSKHPDRLDWLSFWLSDLIRLRLDAHSSALLNPDLTKPLKQLSQTRNIVELFEYLDTLNLVQRSMAQNVNMKLAMEALFVAMTTTQTTRK